MKIPYENFVTCIPIVASDINEAKSLINSAVAFSPDFIEFRYDYFDDTDNLTSLFEFLNQVRDKVGVIFTYRSKDEGGAKDTDNQERLEIIKKAIDHDSLDSVDIETKSEDEFILNVKEELKDKDKQLILSFHDFNKIPETSVIEEIIDQAVEKGDVVKLAFKTDGQKDLEILEKIGKEFREQNYDKPLILIGMSEAGSITRILPERFQSNLTFVSDKKSSAPGQVEFNEFKKKRQQILGNEEV